MQTYLNGENLPKFKPNITGFYSHKRKVKLQKPRKQPILELILDINPQNSHNIAQTHFKNLI